MRIDNWIAREQGSRAGDAPSGFRHVRLELAREPEFPDGSRLRGYDLLVPLDARGHLDPVEWRAHRMACRVRHFSEAEADRIGRLRRKPGGTWYFDYAEGEDDDEIGFRFGVERFVPGEYVSISRQGVTHTYRVTRVQEV